MKRPKTINRRQLLSGGAAVGSSIALYGPAAEARSIKEDMPWQPSQADNPEEAAQGPLRYFTADEAAFLDAAVSRLIPADELGPGAKEAGVTTFLDRQMAGDYGQASHWYMQGPWKKGEATQGYQSRLTPAEMYRTAIKAIDAHCMTNLGGKNFAALSAERQDKLLQDIESGDVELDGVEGVGFFKMFMQNTIEGFFSDPVHGGNRDMVGWKLIGFPGARYDYRPYVSRHGEQIDLPPVGIKGRPAWAKS